MTEEQQPKLPQNAASRALRVVDVMNNTEGRRVHIDNKAIFQILWSDVYRTIFGGVSPLDMSERLRPLIRTFKQVDGFIASGKIKGLVDKNNLISSLAQSIEESASNLSGASTDKRFNYDLLVLILEICAHNMPEEPALGDDALKIQKDLEQCAKEIQKSNLDAVVKEFCLRHISEMIRALDEYGIMGGNSIRKTVISLADEVDQMPQAQKERVPQKFKDGVNQFFNIAQKANVLGQLGKNIAGVIGFGG